MQNRIWLVLVQEGIAALLGQERTMRALIPKQNLSVLSGFH
jgi:hypothetical protein